MIKYCFTCVAVWAACYATHSDAAAQSADVVRKLQAKYDRVTRFHDGLAVVSRNGRYGYVDTNGKLVLPLDYTHAMPFRNGRAVVGKNEKYALIDRAGREVTPYEWDGLGNVNDGVAVGWKQTPEGPRSYALVDTLGKVTLLEYAHCGDFAYGLAVAGIGELTVGKGVCPGLTKVPDKIVFTGKYGYMAPDGTLVIPMQFDDAKPFGDDGLAPVGMQGKYYVKWGFVDRKGAIVIPCDFYSVDRFERGLAVVSKVVSGGKLVYGYIDKAGREVIPCRYDEATRFQFENAWVGTEQEGEMSYQLIDAEGNAVLSYAVFNLQDGGKYGQAACAVRGDDGRLRYGILANSGRLILPFEYDEITIFSEWDVENNRWQEAGMAVKEGKSYSFDISRRDK